MSSRLALLNCVLATGMLSVCCNDQKPVARTTSEPVCQTEAMSIARILTTPTLLDGCRVDITGWLYVVPGIEGYGAVCLTRDDARLALGRNCLTVGSGARLSGVYQEQRLVHVFATFNASTTELVGSPGYLDNIESMQERVEAADRDGMKEFGEP